MRKIFIYLIAIFLFTAGVFAAENVVSIRIEGNKIVSEATIISRIKSRCGQPYNENIINEDVKNIYAAGFFENVEVVKETSSEGVSVIFKVEEKPVLKNLNIKGAKLIRKKKIEDLTDIKEGVFIDEYKLREAVSKIKSFYAEKGFTQTEVNYTIDISEDNNEARVEISIIEKKILKMIRVNVSGNKNISDSKIKRLMKLKQAWFFNKGVFKEDVLGDDVKRIIAYYKLAGFGDVSVETKAEYGGKGVILNIIIDEGKKYFVGEISIDGNKVIAIDKIRAVLSFQEGDVFSEQLVYDNSSMIREAYMEQGYIFCEVEPLSYFNLETQKVDIMYRLIENEPAYIERISVVGNVRTKDEVVRRQLRIYPAEKFDGKKVRKSKERLDNLGFFEEIRFGTEPGSKPNWIDLVIDVKEAKTGYLSFGGGYSSIDAFIGFVEVRQRNFDYSNFSTFTGAGQDLSLTASLGTMTEQYQFSFTNPWVFNRPISFGLDGYKKGHKKEEDVGYGYEESVKGAAVRLNKDFTDNFKGGISYRFEEVKISNVDDTSSQLFKDEVGIANLSSTELNCSFDTRNNVFFPLKGVYFLNNFQMTGGVLGGNRDFLKYFSRVSLYFPMVMKSVMELRLRCGLSEPFGDSSAIPIYERFFVGGGSTIRGYQERQVGPIDETTKDPAGGNSMFVGNIEYTYPLADFIKLAAFSDAGNAWKQNSDLLSGGLKTSIGLGIRVKTPIGPVSIDYGWPFNKEPGEEDKKGGRFHFNVSRGF